jgi:RsiW-degrading membrane proteinase PrsW (M82 family)
MAQYWFKPRTYGYGATPANWRGWVAVAAYVAVVLALVLAVTAWPEDLPRGPAAWQVVTAMAMIGALTWGFVRLCRARTDGEWAWRWGKRR